MRKPGVKSKRPDAKKFFEIYDNEEYTVEEIARLYNVSKATIYNWASQMRKEKLSDKQILLREDCNKNKRKMKGVMGLW